MSKPAKYYVYWNLHKNCFSVKYKGKVVRHTKFIMLYNVEYKVSQAGRERVLREQKKNVHAFVAGDLYTSYCPSYISPLNKWEIITYNPYLHDSFVTREGSRPVSQGKIAVLCVEQDKPVIVGLFHHD